MDALVSRVQDLFGSSLLTRCALACLPLIAGASFATGNTAVLVAAAFVLPVAALGIRPSQARPYRLQLRKGGWADIDATLETALGKSSPTQRCAALLLEVDEFDPLLATWGPEGTTAIMSEITDRLCATLRTSDVVCQIGKNQFELALRDAQSSGIESLRGFSRNTPTASAANSTTGQDVLEALEKGQIIAWFQPQISTDTGKVTGFEALARWDHPTRGTVSPAEFLPALEAAHGMERLSETMLQQSMKALLAWDVAGHKVASVAVNFATDDLRNPSLVERIKWDVDRFDIDPKRLTIEVLETVVAATDDDIITRNIRALADQGYRIDLDDFGTGQASLANIQRFNVDRIKVDRSFVTRADESPEKQRMINAILRMAEQLDIETVAEGVETIGEKSILSQLGCTHMQGFAIARPMPLEHTLPWLSDHHNHLSRAGFFPREAG